ncbi:MAG: helix-turn-helix domain-containing protein [Burkholderiales bacterium]
MSARRGEVVAHAGARSSGLYELVSGSCKSVLATRSGLEYVAGFHLAGDVIGVHGIFGAPQDATIVALEDSVLRVATVESAQRLAARSEPFLCDLWRLMTQEIARQRELTLVLSVMRAEQRLAWFLLDLAARYGANGCSSSAFTLRGTREEIGSNLGVTQETVSRLFRRFHREGVVQVRGRAVKVLDRDALRDLVDDTLGDRDDVPN